MISVNIVASEVLAVSPALQGLLLTVLNGVFLSTLNLWVYSICIQPFNHMYFITLLNTRVQPGALVNSCCVSVAHLIAYHL
jgi:hypothetical protein